MRFGVSSPSTVADVDSTHRSEAVTGAGAGSYQLAWAQVAGAAVALVMLASQLPSPRTTLQTLAGARPAGPDGGVADVAMLSVAALAVWLLLAWVAVISTAALAARLPGFLGAAARRVLSAAAPAAVRNVLLTVVGASMVAGLAGCATVGAGPASAATAAAVIGTSATAGGSFPAAPPTPTATTTATGPASGSGSQLLAQRLIGIATLRISDRIAVEGSAVRSADTPPSGSRSVPPSLDWPTTATASPPRPGGPTPPPRPTTGRGTPPPVSVDWPGPAAPDTDAAGRTVVVLRGDSLWSIAAGSLPAGADDATIDRTWRAWYAANTAVIGSNPDHLLPGQILTPPTTGTVAP